MDQSANTTNDALSFFTSDDKCAYFPNERRIQILQGKPVFPHDGRRYSCTVTDFTFKKGQEEKTTYLHKTVHCIHDCSPLQQIAMAEKIRTWILKG